MKYFLALTFLFSINIYADSIYQFEYILNNPSPAYQEGRSCREVIIEGHKKIGQKINEKFSTKTFEDFKITPAQFNLLDSKTQQEIFHQIQPMAKVKADLIEKLNKQILKLERDTDAFSFISITISGELTQSLRELESCK